MYVRFVGNIYGNWTIQIEHNTSVNLVQRVATMACHQLRYYQSKEEGKDQESIESNTTPDTGHTKGKRQKHKKPSHTGEPRGQVTTRLQGIDKTV